ncbi:hypothetical protein ACFLUP_03390 [Chloroflexota bacterium]
MGQVILRILLGLVIFGLISWLATLVFGVFTGIVNGAAYFLARGTRRLFGFDGTWRFGTSVAAAGIGLGKLVAGSCFFITLFLLCIFYPTIGRVAQVFGAITFFAFLAVWMPSVFFLGLFAGTLEEI